MRGNDEEEKEEENNMEIDASDLKNHPKADSVHGKLNSSGMFKGLISKLAGNNTSFDLNIEVGKVDDGNGTLISSFNNNIFIMRIDEESLLQRTSLNSRYF